MRKLRERPFCAARPAPWLARVNITPCTIWHRLLYRLAARVGHVSDLKAGAGCRVGLAACAVRAYVEWRYVSDRARGVFKCLVRASRAVGRGREANAAVGAMGEAGGAGSLVGREVA